MKPKQTPQQPPPQPPLQLTQLTQILPEPMLISRPSTSLPPLAHVPTHNSRPHQQPDPTAAPVSSWHTPDVIYVSHPPSQPMRFPPPSPQLNPMGTPQFSPQLYPPRHYQPPSFPAPGTTQGMQVTVPSPSPAMYSQPRSHATRSSQPFSQPSAYPHNPHFPSGSQNQYSRAL